MPSVLYVEDTETMQSIYSYALTKEGFTVTLAPTAGEALARLEEQHFDIILLDMMLSGMSGIDFLHTANLSLSSPTTKVIVLSNFDSPNVVQRAQDAGITDYLVKADYEPPALAAYLKKLVPTSTPNTEKPATTAAKKPK